MKELAVIWLFPNLFLVLLAAWFFPMLLWSDPVAESVAGIIVVSALVGIVLVNVVIFTDEEVRGELAVRREFSRFSREQRAERLAAVDAARAAIIVQAAALRAEQAATSILERQFATIAAAQTELCGTFNSAAIELRNLKHLPPAEVEDYSRKLESAFQRTVDHLSLSPLLLESPK